MDLISGLRDAASKQSKPLPAELNAAFALHGRSAVVTGAAMGLGRATARVLAAAGAAVVLADVAAEGLEETRAAIEDGGGSVHVVPTDVSVKDQVDDLARAAVRATGTVDVWVNVAGIIRNAPIVETDEADLDAVLAVNLKGTYWGCAAAGRVMAAGKRGSIVNVASAGGEVPAPTLSVYGMSKAAVIQLTRVAAAELGPAGIRCNAVAPGYVETPMTSRAWTGPDGAVDEDRRSQMLAAMGGQSPLRRTGTPEDIALAILYLASDASSFVTGQVLRANGGVFMA